MNFTFSAPDDTLRAHLQQRIDGKTKPSGALGRLETLALQIGLIQHSATPVLTRPHIMIFAGDHGAACAGVSAYPQEVSWQMVENFLAGGAAINVFCRQLGLGLSIVDAGIKHDFGRRGGLIDAKQAYGTANYLLEPAMSRDACTAALARGWALAHAQADAGCNCMGFGEMGIGNTAAASLLTHCLSGIELDVLIGRGTGLNDAGLARKRALLGQALARGGSPSDPLAALAEYAGFEMVMMAGAMLGAAEKGMVLIIDGFIVTAALLAAHALAPQILPYCVFAHCSDEAGHSRQLDYLGVSPLLDLGLRLGEGSGAALAFPLLAAAVNFLNEMASFESAAVSGQEDLGARASPPHG